MLVPGCVAGGGVVFAGLVVGVVSFPGLAAMAWLIDRMETAPQDIRSTTVLSRALLEVIGEFRCNSPRHVGNYSGAPVGSDGGSL